MQGRANLDFTLKGSKESGQVHLEAVRRDREWDLIRLDLLRDGKDKIDLKTYESVSSATGSIPS